MTEPVAEELLRHEAPAGCARREAVANDDSRGTRVVGSPADLAVQFETGPRIRGAHADQARERVGAVSRTLRASQYFDLPRIDERCRHSDTREIDIVDEKTNRRVRRALVLLDLTDAAQLEKARSRCAGGPVQIRNQGENILEMLDAGSPQRLCVEHRHALRQLGKAG